jgi:arsenate reductase (thioredoxin)
MSGRSYNVLFLCTGNSARSILAETLLNRLGEGRFRAYSAGSQPKGQVYPMAIEVLGELGFPIEDCRSKRWDKFAEPDGPPLDSYSPSATMQTARPAPYGPASR